MKKTKMICDLILKFNESQFEEVKLILENTKIDSCLTYKIKDSFISIGLSQYYEILDSAELVMYFVSNLPKKLIDLFKIANYSMLRIGVYAYQDKPVLCFDGEAMKFIHSIAADIDIDYYF